MLPAEAPKQDWRLYYHNTYMMHTEMGPVHVHVEEDDRGHLVFFAGGVSKGNTLSKKLVLADDLRILWPRPGAYNIGRRAEKRQGIFVGRTPQRQMKRSASSDHYYTLWSAENCFAGYQILNHILGGEHKYFTLEEAWNRPDSHRKASALSINVVVLKTSNKLQLIYRGEEIGLITSDNALHPYLNDDSRLPRFKKHLRTLGIS